MNNDDYKEALFYAMQKMSKGVFIKPVIRI